MKTWITLPAFIVGNLISFQVNASVSCAQSSTGSNLIDVGDSGGVPKSYVLPVKELEKPIKKLLCSMHLDYGSENQQKVLEILANLDLYDSLERLTILKNCVVGEAYPIPSSDRLTYALTMLKFPPGHMLLIALHKASFMPVFKIKQPVVSSSSGQVRSKTRVEMSLTPFIQYAGLLETMTLVQLSHLKSALRSHIFRKPVSCWSADDEGLTDLGSFIAESVIPIEEKKRPYVLRILRLNLDKIFSEAGAFDLDLYTSLVSSLAEFDVEVLECFAFNRHFLLQGSDDPRTILAFIELYKDKTIEQILEFVRQAELRDSLLEQNSDEGYESEDYSFRGSA